jgi:SSS family solute:Na+ symporter
VTVLVIAGLGLMAAYALYLAALTARAGAGLLDGGADIPGWAAMFAGAGVMIAGTGLADHLGLIARFGLQASHPAMGLVLGAMAGLIVQKRLWIAARIAGLTSPGEALGRYYGSITLRIVMLTLAVLFALPWAAHLLSGTAQVVEAATGGAIPRAPAVWVLAFFLFLPAVIGGWRAGLLFMAMQAVLLAVLIPALAAFAEGTLATPGFLDSGIPVADGILRDLIPGVVQHSAGIGKEVVQGGIFTALGIVSSALLFVGVALSPGMLYLAQTTAPGRSAGFGAVWLVAGLGGGLLLIGAPFLAARLGGLDAALAAVDPLAALGVTLMLVSAGQLAVAFFTTSGTLIVTRELILPFIVPGLGPRGQRLATRIALALAYLMLATLAAFAPLGAAVFGALALPFAVQLLPALIGLCFVRWISRSAVLAGLVFGLLIVTFTEPLGLILFEGLFMDLPWGRWPLTIHSAAWGLAFNAGVVLLASIFTARGPERAHRDLLHGEFAARWAAPAGRPNGGAALWSLTLIWAFLAMGPGAILGNSFFSRPIFVEGEAALGLPSLWVWQILFWLVGTAMVWWLAHRARLGQTATEPLRPIAFPDPARPDGPARAPDWIAAGLARITREVR